MKFKSLATALTAAIALPTFATNQIDNLWQAENTDMRKHSSMQDSVSLKLAYDVFASRLALAPQQINADQGIQIDLPLPSGKFVRFELFESSIMESGLAEKFPTIKTFWGKQVGNPENVGRFDIGPQGFHGMFEHGGKQVFVDPSKQGEVDQYRIYFQSALGQKRFADKVLKPKDDKKAHRAAASALGTDGQERSYRIAVAVTGEYTQFHGGTKESGLAAVTTAINRVNQVYQNDLAVKFLLVANNDRLIYTDASTDPYNNDDSDLDKNTSNIDKEIGASNYDIGHIFVTTGGGVAGFGVVCTGSKGDGLTGSPTPSGDAFYIDYVAHEIGHQFGAEHTFNGCDDNRAPNWAFEPGSGTTIMSYAGLCDDKNVQNNSDAYFHTKSLEQIYQFITSGEGASCANKSNINNQAPTVDAGRDYTIPARTPFELVGNGTDSDPGDQTLLTYTWEQVDLGPEEKSESDMVDDGKRPLFRSFQPTTSRKRLVPQLSDVLANQTTKGETYATTDRDLNFNLTVRDTKGGTTSDRVKLTVKKDAGPFKITSPVTASWAPESQQTINWDVANTNQAPINCTVVDISLSLDDGITFSEALASNTANDGSETISVPNVSTSKGRVKVKCSDNVFLDINKGAISINGSGGNGSNQTPQITGQRALSIDEDSPLTIQLSDLTVNDPDNNYPNDFSLTVMVGNNYQVSDSTITPAADFNGQLSINLKVNDGKSDSNTFALTVTVNPINDAPIANDDQFEVNQDASAVEIKVLSNDSDKDANDSISIESINYSGNATVSHNNDSISYQPASGFSGSESIRYTIKDKSGSTASATLTITVKASSGNSGNNDSGTDFGGSSGGGALYWLLLVGLLNLSRKRR